MPADCDETRARPAPNPIPPDDIYRICWLAHLPLGAIGKKDRVIAGPAPNIAHNPHEQVEPARVDDAPSNDARDLQSAKVGRRYPFRIGSNRRDDDRMVERQLVPTDAWRKPMIAGTSRFWSSPVRTT